MPRTNVKRAFDEKSPVLHKNTRPGGGLSYRDVGEMAHGYQEGLTLREIRDITGLSLYRIRRELLKAGVKMREGIGGRRAR